MSQVIEKVFAASSIEWREIDNLLNRLGATAELTNFDELLVELKSTLDAGITTGFVSQIRQIHMYSLLPAIWERWSYLITKVVDGSESLKKVGARHRVRNRGLPSLNKIKLLTLQKPELGEIPTKNVKSIKIIYLALLGLPDDEIMELKPDDLIKIFFNGASRISKYKGLELDFEKYDVFEIINHTERMVIEAGYEPGSERRVFLEGIRNSLLILLGHELGNRRSDTTDISDVQRSSSRNRKPTTIRLTPYKRRESAEELDVGALVGLETEEEEPRIIGLLSNDDSDEYVNEPVSRTITQIKAKHWVKTFHSNLPWGSRGINPVTRKILGKWVSENEDDISMLFGLMICTGERLEKVMDMDFGVGNKISSSGYVRTYVCPENSKEPDDIVKNHTESRFNEYVMPFPAFISNRLVAYEGRADDKARLCDVLSRDIGKTKIEASSKVKELVDNGALGLTIDRVPLVLSEMIAEKTGDEFLNYIIAGRENDMPPISAYYSAYTIEQIEGIYRSIMDEIFE